MALKNQCNIISTPVRNKLTDFGNLGEEGDLVKIIEQFFFSYHEHLILNDERTELQQTIQIGMICLKTLNTCTKNIHVPVLL